MDNEMWVLLAEKAMAKWFGSYVQIQGAYCLVAYLLLTEVGECKVFTQNPSSQPPFNTELYSMVNITMAEAHNRNSVQLGPQPGQYPADQVWAELCNADQQNFIMASFTFKDPAQTAGVGASGEIIASDGIVKGHAYSVISAREVQADGRIWRVLQVRNPWGANPAAEWNGVLSDKWPEWNSYPELRQALEIGNSELDGMFWMTWDDFRNRFSDVGIVPKQMEVPRLGAVEGLVKTGDNSKHTKRFQSAAGVLQPLAQVEYVEQQVEYVQPQVVEYFQQPQVIEYVQPAAPVHCAMPPSEAVPMEPRYVKPTRTVYAGAPATYASAPQTYAAAPAPPTYAAAPSYSAAPSYLAAPSYSAAPTYAAAPT